jgi:hypothetical protein
MLLNHEHIGSEIGDQLKKLKMFPLSENSKAVADEIARCVSHIHSHDLSQSNLPVYDARWVIQLVRESESCGCKDEIIAALEFANKIERYNYFDGPEIFGYDEFMAWDIDNAQWQSEYGSGHVGRYLWDIAAIMNHVGDSSFSDVFLDGYIRHSGKEFSLADLYSNLYYVQVAEAARSDDFEEVLKKARELTGKKILKSELISEETLDRLKIDGF